MMMARRKEEDYVYVLLALNRPTFGVYGSSDAVASRLLSGMTWCDVRQSAYGHWTVRSTDHIIAGSRPKDLSLQ